MTDREELKKSIEGIAYGYLILHFDINLGVLNLLSDWLGYIAIVHVLDVLGEEEPSANLLKPLGYLLIVSEVWDSILNFGGAAKFSNYGLAAIIGAVSLYFHFQLLTNLAAIAEKYEYSKHQNLLKLRTVRTLLLTLMTMPLPWEKYSMVTAGLAIVGIIVGIWICIELFGLKRHILEDSTDNRLENEE